MVIWPENTTGLEPGLNPVIYAAIQSAVDAAGRPVLVSAVLANPRRNAGQRDCRAAVPSPSTSRASSSRSEYIPFRGLLSAGIVAGVPIGHSRVLLTAGYERIR